jgi:hypothetical protein
MDGNLVQQVNENKEEEENEDIMGVPVYCDICRK